MTPDNGNGRKLVVGLPPWVVAVGKTGLWAALAIWLIYALVLQRNEDLRLTRELVAANGAAIQRVQVTIDRAEARMERFATEQEERTDVVINILLEMCVQRAETASDQKACVKAAANPAVK